MMKRLIIDTSSVVKRCLYGGTDAENGKKVLFNGRQVQVNSASYGYDCSVNSIVACLNELNMVPSDIIFVVESGASKIRRQQIYKGYKEKREESPPELNDNFGKARDMVLEAFRNLGSTIVTQPHMEGDDVIAYLVGKLKGTKIVFSEDGDLATLLAPDVMLYRQGQLVTENPYGPFEPRHIPVMKALVGDGDEYKGAVGFGEKAWLALLVNYGDCLDALETFMRDKRLVELEDDAPSFKPFRKVIDGAEHVYQSYQCALLHPEWVDTFRTPLQWKGGMVKPATDYRMKKWGQQIRLITADNYGEAVKFLADRLRFSRFVTLDIETSTSEESDEWMAARNAEEKLDVLGSDLTGLGLTFGDNSQYTYYFSVDHRDTNNCTIEQVREAVALVQQDIHIVVHNAAFELPVLYRTWGTQQLDNGWHGFLPNVIDTAICSSYVDENQSQGLKQNSLLYLDYEQQNYDSVTTLTGEVGTLPAGGKVVKSWEEPVLDEEGNPVTVTLLLDTEDGNTKESEQAVVTHHEARQYKMNELTAEHVLSYGTDDTICTAGLFNFFRTRMEIENTWNVMLEVEQLPAYVCALAYTQGTEFSLQRMLELEKEDKETYEQSWQVIRSFLIEQGWEGTVCPTYQELTPAAVKEITQIVLGLELKTMIRTVSKLAKLIEVMDHDDAPLLAKYVDEDNLDQINDWVKSRFQGEPIFDTGSPKQMKKFLYDTLGLPVRVVNSCTEKERNEKRELAAAVSRHKKIWAGSESEAPLTDEEKELLKAKAKTDDTAVDFALLLDRPDDPILKAFQVMKKCMTRQTLFYNNYRNLLHWRDRRIHGQAGQTRTVTRRFAPSDPNLAQLPKKGEGVKFRGCFKPHKKDAVVVSIDFSGQELRQGAGQSGDANMLACFVGDNLKDMHSMTAAGAMEKKWGRKKLDELISRFGKPDDSDYELFVRLRKTKEDDAVAKLADDLRKNAKNVNFGAQYDAQAPKLAETLIIPVADAQTFLDAKFAMFPRFEEWKEEVKQQAQRDGFVTTCMGARRHLREALLSDNKWDVEKALRQGPNFKIQGSSAEQTKLAMARLWRSGVLWKYDVVFFAPIHDELVFSVHKDHAVEVIRIIHECMTQPYGDLPVPFLGSISLGLDFADQHEAGDWFIEENIREILTELFKEEVATP